MLAIVSGCALPDYEVDPTRDYPCAIVPDGVCDWTCRWPDPDCAGACPAEAHYPNLVNETGWVGCDPANPNDNPAGIQGAFYVYGDGIACAPPAANPCKAEGCCLDGTTIVDSTYAAWGCGIGLLLNATADEVPVRSAYAGSANCFSFTLTGSSGGNVVRIGFTQYADNNGVVAPFVEVPAVNGSYSGMVCFADVVCPNWPDVTCAVTGQAYDVQIQVPGGNTESAFRLCLTSLIPDSM